MDREISDFVIPTLFKARNLPLEGSIITLGGPTLAFGPWEYSIPYILASFQSCLDKHLVLSTLKGHVLALSILFQKPLALHSCQDHYRRNCLC